jgi:DNA-binding NarL/FixJ family response regulator
LFSQLPADDFPMTQENKIVIVEDHDLFRESLRLLIEKEGMGAVVAEAKNGMEMLSLLKTNIPDVIIMGIEMPLMNGMDAAREALSIYPGLKILLLTMYFEKEYIPVIHDSGAMGLILKTSVKRELANALRAISRGNTYFPEQKPKL